MSAYRGVAAPVAASAAVVFWFLAGVDRRTVSGGAIGGRGVGVAAPPDSRFVKYGAPVQQVVNI